MVAELISLEALQALDSIDRKGSFAAAAEELFRVPSAITYTIKKLEDQLSIKLFDRDKQRAQLTTAGKIILDQGRDILAQVQRLEEQAKRVEAGWETELRIVVDTILPVGPLWPLIDELMRAHPSLNVQLREEALSGSWEALINQRAELVIGVTGDEPVGGHWQKQSLGQMTMELYCSSLHPASQLPQPIDSAQLKSFTHIVVGDSARYLPQRNVGLLGLKQVLSVPNMVQKYEALINNIGLSHLPEHLARPAIKEGLLTQLTTESAPLPQNLFMVWPKNGSGKANFWLRQKIFDLNVFNIAL